MKKYNPIEELDNRLEALYPRKGGADIPKDTALRNFNAVVRDVLKGEGKIKDIMKNIMAKVLNHAPNIHSNWLKRIRDNLKAMTVSYVDDRAEWKKVGEKLDYDFEPLIKARQKKELVSQRKKESTKFTM